MNPHDYLVAEVTGYLLFPIWALCGSVYPWCVRYLLIDVLGYRSYKVCLWHNAYFGGFSGRGWINKGERESFGIFRH